MQATIAGIFAIIAVKLINLGMIKMTTHKSWTTTALVLVVCATLLTACGGNKKNVDKSAAQQAEPTQDITYPPTIIAPKEVEPEDSQPEETPPES